jgi:superoxide dismutase, Fe-Mn family
MSALRSLSLFALVSVTALGCSSSSPAPKSAEPAPTVAEPPAPVAGTEPVTHEFAPLPYAYDALEPHIDATTMEIHYDRHHRGYYNNFLAAIEGTNFAYLTLEQIFALPGKLPPAVRNNAGGYWNHQLFWNLMSPEGGGAPEGELAKQIDQQFGSFDAFKAQFEKAALTRFGSGWAWLNVDKAGKLFISSTANQDNPLMSTAERQGTPILALDVWEHAYYLKYQNKRGTYASAFWNVVDWPAVGERLASATAAAK